MDNKKRLKRKVNAKLKTVLLMLLAIMFVISSLMTVSAATIKDDGKYTLLLTCASDGKIDGDYAKIIRFDVADGDTTVSLSELTAGILPFNGRTQFAYWATDWSGETRAPEDIPLSDFNSEGTFWVNDGEVDYTNGLTIYAAFSEEALKGTGTYYLTLDGLGGTVNGKYEITLKSSSSEYQTVDLTQYVPVREGYTFVESLGKNVLKTYYFLLAAASFRAREDSWQIELEHCSAVPSKTVKLSDDELQEIFRSGDQTRLMDTVKTWEIMAEQDTKTEPYLNLWFGILMAATAIGYGIWTFVVGSSDSYYNFMLIGATLLLVGLWILVSVRIVYLLRRSQNKGKGLGKKKGIRFLTLFILVLMWCFIVGLSLVIFVGAGSDIHTQWEAMKTGKQQESQDETYHNGTEISTEADIKNQETENTEMASEIIEDTELKPDQSNIVKSGPITDSEYASFQITADASSVEGFDVFQRCTLVYGEQ